MREKLKSYNDIMWVTLTAFTDLSERLMLHFLLSLPVYIDKCVLSSAHIYDLDVQHKLHSIMLNSAIYSTCA